MKCILVWTDKRIRQGEHHLLITESDAMTVLAWLIPIALVMGLVALRAFMWSIESGQYDDIAGAAERVLLHPQEDHPLLDEVERGSLEELNDAGISSNEK